MTIIEYINANNLTIQFEDGMILKNKIYKDFKKGGISKYGQFKDRTGETNFATNGQKITIVKYISKRKIIVEFEDGTQIFSRYAEFKDGCITNPNIPLIQGIGYIGIGEYNSYHQSYEKWVKMFNRCYNENNRMNAPTYKDVSICEEWHNYQNFAKWYDNNLWDKNFTVLDKDILIKGNKLYSPDTCCLVNQRLNSLFVKNTSNRGECPIGVHPRKDNGRFYARCNTTTNGKHTPVCLGNYSSPEEAFNAYKKFKESYIKQVADEYKNKYPNFPQKLYDAMYNYEVEITD